VTVDQEGSYGPAPAIVAQTAALAIADAARAALRREQR
jgi:hypothetical protein